jgi:hypothetical protein
MKQGDFAPEKLFCRLSKELCELFPLHCEPSKLC